MFQVGPLSALVIGTPASPTLTQDSESDGRRFQGSGTIDEPYVVDWIGHDDTENPHNWGDPYRYMLAFLIGTSAFCVTYASSAYTGGLNGIIRDLDTSLDIALLGLALYVLGFGLGPLIWGPLSEGFISGSGHKGWRWNFGAMFIFAVVTLIAMVIIPETFAPVLLRRRAERLQKQSDGRFHYVSKFDLHGKKKPSTTLRIALSRPFAILAHEPIVVILTIYMSLIYGVLYGLFACFPIIFGSHRHWSPGQSGLAFLGVGVGICISIGLAPVFNRRYMRIAQKGQVEPEERLVMCCVGAILLPISLVWFAWTSYPSVRWIVPVLAGVPFGTGIIFTFTSVVAYLVDTYTLYAASCLAANSVVRSIVAFAFPLFVPRLFQRVGDQWACMVFGFMALVCLPMPFLIYRYGPLIRSKSKLIDQLNHASTISRPAPDGIVKDEKVYV